MPVPPSELMQPSVIRDPAGKAGLRAGALLQLLLLILLALLVLVPLLWLVTTSLKGPAEDIFYQSPSPAALATQS